MKVYIIIKPYSDTEQGNFKFKQLQLSSRCNLQYFW